jgi:hypothetical protein
VLLSTWGFVPIFPTVQASDVVVAEAGTAVGPLDIGELCRSNPQQHAAFLCACGSTFSGPFGPREILRLIVGNAAQMIFSRPCGHAIAGFLVLGLHRSVFGNCLQGD